MQTSTVPFVTVTTVWCPTWNVTVPARNGICTVCGLTGHKAG
jgi:hypothetical protein